MNKFTTALIAAAVLVASASAAMAAPGVITGNANVRAGAGTGYPVISSVQYGQNVNVDGCQGNWCHVEKPGKDGWVSASFIAMGNNGGWNNGHHNNGGWNNNNRHGNGNHGNGNGWNNHNNHQDVGGSVCAGGPNASFCLGF